MTESIKGNALLEQGVESTNLTAYKQKSITKRDRVIEALKTPSGLNRFEAEKIGEHCLNSTMSIIRRIYGDKLIQERETVPSRYKSDGVSVVRYWLKGL